MKGKEEAVYELCPDTSDCIEISFTSGLYLKPITKLNITVTIPHLKSGQVISNKEIIEKLRIAIRPEKFASIKATKSNLEFLRFDAELDNKKKLDFVVSKIDQKGIKLGGFNEVLKIRASEGKVPFPSRHDWDSYFKETKHMNEKKPGERPDTVHIKDIPCEWFIHNEDPTGSCPSEYVVSKVFSSFGEIRALDIPYLDPYRKRMSSDISGVNKFALSESAVFDVYIQYKEYVGFAKCMHMLQAKKLIIQKDESVYMANIKVDFDKTKHLSDASMKRREIEREKIMSTSVHLQEKSRMKKEISEMKKDAEILERYNAEEKERKRTEDKEERKKSKEEKRKKKEIKKRLKKLMAKHKDLTDIDDMEGKLTKKVAIEERKLVIAQRTVEAVRLYEKIFDRIKIYHQKEAAIKSTMYASGIQSEPILFGHWFSGDCRVLMKKKKILYGKFKNLQSNENWLHYKKCSHKLKKIAHNQKLKFMGSCLKNAKGVSNKELDELRKRDLASCKKAIRLSRARQMDQMQTQQKRVEKVMRGKIQVIFLPCDDENKVALSPKSSGDSSSSSALSQSDDSDSEKEKKMFAGKMRADQLESHDMFRNQMQPDHFQGHYFHGNFRPRGSYGMAQGQPFQYDNRGRGFRFFRPFYNRGFRGGPHQGFENRGRGFYQYRGRFPYDKNRGRGGYFDYKAIHEHPIQLGEEKWFKRGNEVEEEEQAYHKPKYQKSRHRSASWSQSRSGSRNRSRSWSRSRSRSYSRSYSRSRSNKRDEYTSKSKKKRSRRSSSSESRSASRDRKQRRSVESVRSSSDANVKPRKSRKDRSWSRSSDSRSHLELSEEEEEYDNFQGHHYNDKFVNRRFNSDFRGRGRGSRPFYNYRGNQRQRRFRGTWRGRGRGYISHNYNQNEHDDDYNEQCLNLYKKYFNRITEKDSYNKRDSSSDSEYRHRNLSDSASDISEKKVIVKSRVKYGKPTKDRQKDQIDDMNARYREEEERARADKLQQQDQVPVKRRNKRNIRGRFDDSEDGSSAKKIQKRYSVSDQESYGPSPPKRIKTRKHKK